METHNWREDSLQSCQGPGHPLIPAALCAAKEGNNEGNEGNPPPPCRVVIQAQYGSCKGIEVSTTGPGGYVWLKIDIDKHTVEDVGNRGHTQTRTYKYGEQVKNADWLLPFLSL